MEATILRTALTSREAFDELLVADVYDDFSDMGKIVWKEIKDYYHADPEAQSVDHEVFGSTIARKYEKHADKIESFVATGDAVSVKNVIKEVFELKLEAVRHKMSQALVASKDDEYLQLRDKYDKLQRGEMDAHGESSEVVVSKPLDAILKSYAAENKIKVLPRVLNDALDGGVIADGTHIVIFAPTEMGKTLFCLNMASGFLRQGIPVMYGCNEDPEDAMLLRLMYRLSNMTKPEIEQNPAKAAARAEKAGYSNLTYLDLKPGTEAEIRKLVEEYRPKVLMIDQIRNLDMREPSKVLALEKAATMMRNIAKKYGLVAVSITQAADSATGKVMLDRGDIDFSNIGIPGTADLMIGIGADMEMEQRGQRLLSLVKNKISGNHEPLRVAFDNKLTKVT